MTDRAESVTEKSKFRIRRMTDLYLRADIALGFFFCMVLEKGMKE